MLGGAGLFRVFRLQRAVPELAIVAASVHTKPLRRFLQSVGRYQVLGLSRHRVQLFEGDRNVLDEIALGAGVPATIDDALGDELTDPRIAMWFMRVLAAKLFASWPQPCSITINGSCSPNFLMEKQSARELQIRCAVRSIGGYANAQTRLPDPPDRSRGGAAGATPRGGWTGVAP